MILSVGLFALAAAPTAVIVLIHGNPFQGFAAVSASADRRRAALTNGSTARLSNGLVIGPDFGIFAQDRVHFLEDGVEIGF